MLNGLTIRLRLIVVLGLLSAMLVVGAVVGLTALSRANASMETMYKDRLVALAQLHDVVVGLNQSQLNLAEAVISNAEVATKMTDTVQEDTKKLRAALEQYKATKLTPREAELAKDFEARFATYLSQAQAPMIEHLRAGMISDAGTTLHEQVVPLFAPIRKDMADLVKLQLDVSQDAYTGSRTEYHFVFVSCIVALLGGLAIAGFMGVLLVRAIVRPLNYAVKVSEAIAGGNLTHTINTESNDEMGRLMTALRAMQDSLSGIVSKVRGGTDLIATASQEIASGNMDLSARTESQASSLEETASSMEELTSTVRQNADNARQANTLAQAASELAGRGGVVVADVVTTMESINTSSNKIVDIISVIDGIAFQTNILALNAAVEAARAGEQGRGFAVVASEVRNLAQRSAAAAKEIKTLIDDSVGKVENGTRLVGEAGSTMKQIVDGIQRVADIMGEISSASGEQTSGIEQVKEAIEQMDTATQQNASLVEEAAAAAASMQEQAAELARLVGIFQVNATPAVQAPVRRPALALRRERLAA
ncbi:HAMP domain-containing protein [Massilia arenosa]|uniref:HAMP domain-containing protein n=1 Tax=Zemynaea arenosa TaxID=2561931 RepID=A0A4Y9RQ24_9BURK|nr:methyl-accepting chemotaxis protein [Massilia arenosa]TFW11437.1 HAMP domain-containing protein [Massilia arenosa]